MQELCFKEGSEILAFFQAEKGRENRFIVLLGGSTGCRTKLHPPAMASSADFLSLSLSPSPRFLRKLQQKPLSRTGDVLMLGSFLSGGLWAPGQHLLCVCSPVASGLLVSTSCAFALRWPLGSWSAPPVRLLFGGLWAPGPHLLCVCSPVVSGLLVSTSCAFAGGEPVLDPG